MFLHQTDSTQYSADDPPYATITNPMPMNGVTPREYEIPHDKPQEIASMVTEEQPK